MGARSLLLISLLLLVSGLMGCSRNEPSLPFEARPNGMFPGQPDTPYEEYRIGLGDELTMAVQSHPEFSGNLTVETSGFVTLPTSLDRIKAAGNTLRELETNIKETLSPYLVDSPRISVSLTKPNSRFVYVLGAVRQPGKYTLKDEHLDVREAIVRAGLPLREAALKRTLLYSSNVNYSASRKINLKDVLHKGRLEENFEMQHGDVLYVPNIYVWDLSWWLTQMLRPFQIIVNYDETASSIGDIPTGSSGTAGSVN